MKTKDRSTTSAFSSPTSLIKPQLRNLSGSGKQMRGAIIERDLEDPRSSVDITPGSNTKHVLLVPARSSARLELTAAGRRKESLYAPGDLILNPAGNSMAPRWHAPIELILFAIDPAHMATAAEAMGTKPNFELETKFQFEDPLLEQLVRTLIRQFEAKAPADLLYTESLTQTLILHLLRVHSSVTVPGSRLRHSGPEPRVRRALEFIREHLSQKLSLEQIAREADLNSSQFCHVFKASMGVSPHRYVLSQRIEQALALLRDTRLSVSEIAAQTGFADQSHLTRLMRQVRGITPGQVRQRT